MSGHLPDNARCFKNHLAMLDVSCQGDALTDTCQGLSPDSLTCVHVSKLLLLWRGSFTVGPAGPITQGSKCPGCDMRCVAVVLVLFYILSKSKEKMVAMCGHLYDDAF